MTRRLQAMFERLLLSLPPQRAAEIAEQMSMLRRTVGHTYSDAQDRAMASCADLQGFGSPSHSKLPKAGVGRGDGPAATAAVE